MITITKKESSLVWMLHKAKTARLVITLYRHITDKLPTSYRHITNCRPTVGRLSADCRPTDSLCFGENLSAVCRPTVGRQSANSRPTDGRQLADSRPTVGRQSADSRPTVGRQVFWGALLHNYLYFLLVYPQRGYISFSVAWFLGFSFPFRLALLFARFVIKIWRHREKLLQVCSSLFLFPLVSWLLLSQVFLLRVILL